MRTFEEVLKSGEGLDLSISGCFFSSDISQEQFEQMISSTGVTILKRSIDCIEYKVNDFIDLALILNPKIQENIKEEALKDLGIELQRSLVISLASGYGRFDKEKVMQEYEEKIKEILRKISESDSNGVYWTAHKPKIIYINPKKQKSYQ